MGELHKDDVTEKSLTESHLYRSKKKTSIEKYWENKELEGEESQPEVNKTLELSLNEDIY